LGNGWLGAWIWQKGDKLEIFQLFQKIGICTEEAFLVSANKENDVVTQMKIKNEAEMIFS
jgi:hypothetical protein